VARITDWHRAAAITQAWRGNADEQPKRGNQRQHRVSFHKFPFAPSVEFWFSGNFRLLERRAFSGKRIVGLPAVSAGE
jgi:hypothetical protein